MQAAAAKEPAQSTIARAQTLITAQSRDVTTALALAAELQRHFEYDLARRLLLTASDSKDMIRPGHINDPALAEQLTLALSLCTYKDHQLPPDDRFYLALELLDLLGLRSPACRNPEVLGQGGAIYKRKWESEGEVENLLIALDFYQAGWERNPGDDLGYCGINAAFIHDILAERARMLTLRAGYDSGGQQRHRAAADSLRLQILEKLPPLLNTQQPCYWHLATLGEAAWGLRQWSVSANWFKAARACDPQEWQLETSVKQLIAIAQYQEIQLNVPHADESNGPWQVLQALAGPQIEPLLSANRGKIGLALSGGGFRAALYHLGVLARLAEVDALRGVEVISTVSGGSIVGAQYYLALQQLLESRPDGAITRADYVKLVSDLIPPFVAAVQKNLRVRAFTNLVDNFRMFGAAFTRSNRIGELYDDYLFKQFPIPGQAQPGDAGRRSMDKLKIQPAAMPADFHPKFSNWRRSSKVPILLINTTSLNSGHNWHFTASWMGEPPGLIGEQIDMNQRYRRLYYREAPTDALRQFPLAYAVAASAGVPALFNPIPIKDLYPDRKVQLVDGGVHDNQGVAGLLDEACSIILCSDASGQMDDQIKPATNMLGVFFRSDGILQDRLREAQLKDLSMRVKSRSLQGLFYIHLKQDLQQPPLTWTGGVAPTPVQLPSATSYGVDREIQQKLSEIRTDLDSFTDVEAYTLMASGYLTTAHQLEVLDKEFKRLNPGQNWSGFDIQAPRADQSVNTTRWPFIAMFEVMRRPPVGAADPQRDDLGVQLGVSRELFGKVWRLDKRLSYGGAVAGLLALCALGYQVKRHWGDSWSFELGVAQVVMALVGVAALITMPMLKYLRFRKAASSVMIKALLATLGAAASHLHLLVFDPMFLRRGKLERLLSLKKKSAAGPSSSASMNGSEDVEAAGALK